MKLLVRLIGWVSALALALAIGGFIIDHNIFRSQVVLEAIHTSGTCQAVAQAAPVILTTSLNLPATYESNFKGVVTSSYVCDRLDQFIPQLDAYYRSNGPAPQIDLTDLKTRLVKTGVSLPQATRDRLATPIIYRNPDIDGPLMQLAHSSQRSTNLALLVVLVGLIMTWLIGGHKRWQAAGRIFFSTGLILAVEAGLITLIPTLISSPVASSPFVALAPAIKSLSRILASATTHQLLISAGGCMAVAGLLVVAGWLLSHKPHHALKTEAIEIVEE